LKEITNKRGGLRSGSGRKAGKSQTPISLKLDNDLMAIFKSYVSDIPNRGRYINEAVRKALAEDGYLPLNKKLP